MRVIKLSPDDDEMETRADVVSFFTQKLQVKSRAGRFGLTEAKENLTGIKKGTLLVFSYETECMFLARAASGIIHRPGRNAHFVVDLDTICPIQGPLLAYEKALRKKGLSDKHLVNTQAWPILSDDCEAFTLKFFKVRLGKRTPGTSKQAASTKQRRRSMPSIKLKAITAEEIIAFVNEQPGEYPTAAGNTKFSVLPEGDGIRFIIANGKRTENLSREVLLRYVAVFNRKPSFNSAPFRNSRAAYFCTSYFLGLVRQIQFGKQTVDELLGKLSHEPDGVPVHSFEIRPPKKKKGKTKGASRGRRSTESKKVGNFGELIVLDAERKRLQAAGRSDLAAKIEHVAAKGLTPGYDILSFESNEAQRFVEVKASSGKVISSVELTANEWRIASHSSHRKAYHIYLVTDVFGSPAIEVLTNPHGYVEKGHLTVEPSQYLLDLRARK